MKIDEWMRQRRLHRLLIMVPFWTVAYFIGTLIFHWVFGWEIRWQSVLTWGLCMGVSYTLWPPGARLNEGLGKSVAVLAVSPAIQK